MPDAEQVRALRKSGQHEAARTLAVDLVQRNPSDAELQYEAASVHDYLGLGAQAIPFYHAALRGPLADELQRGAFVGLCSTYRARGACREALAVADEGLSRFPDSSALKVFRAITLYNLDEPKQAVAALLQVLAHTSADPEIGEYRRALLLYAQDLDRQWR